MQFWKDCLATYTQQRYAQRRFLPRLVFDLDHLLQVFTTATGNKPLCIEDVLTDLLMAGLVVPVEEYTPESTALGTVYNFSVSVGRWVFGTRPSLPKTQFVYLPTP